MSFTSIFQYKNLIMRSIYYKIFEENIHNKQKKWAIKS